jgi:hypothetical protein
MEHQLWKAILTLLKVVDKRVKSGRETFSDEDVVKVWFWAVLHNQTVCWACNAQNYPLQERRWKKPSPSRISRRLPSPSVQHLLEQIEQQVLAPQGLSIVWVLDGKPLPIGGCSKDRQAGYGRAAGCKAKGYKLHALISTAGDVAAWRIAPMNKDERVMAKRMLQTAPVQGYVLADSNYDSNELHKVCDHRGNLQLVSPRRYGPGRGHGHRRQTPGRMRSKELLENPYPFFGATLFANRTCVERFFGSLTNCANGLTHLPPWIRSHRRVRQWVQAKLVLHGLKRRLKQTNLRQMTQ